MAQYIFLWVINYKKVEGKTCIVHSCFKLHFLLDSITTYACKQIVKAKAKAIKYRAMN
jgi:hypothetical protein